ncbi:hypothetical protein IWW36_005232, partial [Coemansia brasiliensis]
MIVACATTVDVAKPLEVKPQSLEENIILYVPGGGFIVSDAPSLKWVYLKTSQELRQRVFVPCYRVAPTHLFPHAPHDVYTAYLHLLHVGFKAKNITVMGISASGN